MFSTGQLIFALLFLVGFVIVMVFSYRNDKKRNEKYYKGSFWVLVGFLLFLAILFSIKIYFNE